MDVNPSDVSAKELIWDDPAAWVERFGIGLPGPVSVVESNITTMTAAADKVVRVGADKPYLVNLEPHAYHERICLARFGIARWPSITGTTCPCSPC